MPTTFDIPSLIQSLDDLQAALPSQGTNNYKFNRVGDILTITWDDTVEVVEFTIDIAQRIATFPDSFPQVRLDTIKASYQAYKQKSQRETDKETIDAVIASLNGTKIVSLTIGDMRKIMAVLLYQQNAIGRDLDDDLTVQFNDNWHKRRAGR